MRAEPNDSKHNRDHNQEEIESGEDKQILVSKKEYEKLVAECLSQESLIEGLQKENERLYHVMREKQIGERASKATFFDQQEQMNKELNRLRNAVGAVPESHPLFPGVTDGLGVEFGNDGYLLSGDSASNTGKTSIGGSVLVRKSADLLRAELDIDATIRALRERAAIAESNMGARELELQQTIEKLRKENRELIEATARNKQHIMTEVLGEQQLLEQKLNQCKSENDDLKTRLVWFAENQELLETAEIEKTGLRHQISVLKRELKRRGVGSAQIEAFFSSGQSGSGQ